MQYLDAISKMTEWSVRLQGKPFNITVIQVYAPTSNAEETEVERFYEDIQDLLELTAKKDVLFIIGDWNAKVRSQETPGVTGKFGLRMWNEAGQRLIEFCQENALVMESYSRCIINLKKTFKLFQHVVLLYRDIWVPIIPHPWQHVVFVCLLSLGILMSI